MVWRELEIFKNTKAFKDVELCSYTVRGKLEGIIFPTWLTKSLRIKDFGTLKEAREFVEDLELAACELIITKVE